MNTNRFADIGFYLLDAIEESQISQKMNPNQKRSYHYLSHPRYSEFQQIHEKSRNLFWVQPVLLQGFSEPLLVNYSSDYLQ